MKFKIKVKRPTGEVAEEVREAKDKFSLARELRAAGNVLITVESLDQPGFGRRALFSGWLTRKVKLKDKIVFAGNLASMITAGLALSRALMILGRQTTNPRFKEIITKILDKVNAGQNLSAALADWPDVFPPVFTAMVAAGEESGKLPEALSLISDQLNKSYEIQRKIKGALMYPSIIVTLIIILGALMMVFLMPILTKTFKSLGVALPLSTRILIWISNFLNAHYVAVLVGLLVIGLGLYFWLRTRVGSRAVDFVVLHLPILRNMSRLTNSAIMMRTISSLIKSGVSMIEALRITERVLQNSYYKEVMTLSLDRIQQGAPLSDLLREREDIFPILVGEMVLVGEETGNLPQMLEKGAVFYEGEVDQITKNFSAVIEPVIMVLIGVAVAFFAVSVMGPMYSLSNAIK